MKFLQANEKQLAENVVRTFYLKFDNSAVYMVLLSYDRSAWKVGLIDFYQNQLYFSSVTIWG